MIYWSMSRRDQLVSAYLHMDMVIAKREQNLWYDTHFDSWIPGICPVSFVTEKHTETGIEPLSCGLPIQYYNHHTNRFFYDGMPDVTHLMVKVTLVLNRVHYSAPKVSVSQESYLSASVRKKNVSETELIIISPA